MTHCVLLTKVKMKCDNRQLIAACHTRKSGIAHGGSAVLDHVMSSRSTMFKACDLTPLDLSSTSVISCFER